jgi:hypothetical protein
VLCTVRKLQIEPVQFRIGDRCFQDDEIAPGARIHRIALLLHCHQLVRDGRDHAEREGGVCHMPVLVPEMPATGADNNVIVGLHVLLSALSLDAL